MGIKRFFNSSPYLLISWLFNFVLGGFTVYQMVHIPSTKLTLDLVSESDVINVQGTHSDLKILYGQTQIHDDKQSLKLIKVKLKNSGDKDIPENNIDRTVDFGIQIPNSTILSTAIVSSGTKYLNYDKVINNINADTIKFHPFFFSENDYIEFQILMVLEKNHTVQPKLIGTIAGLSDVNYERTSENEKSGLKWKSIMAGSFGLHLIRALAYFLIVVVFVLILAFLSFLVEKINDQIQIKRRRKILKDFQNLMKNPFAALELIKDDYVKNGSGIILYLKVLNENSDFAKKLYLSNTEQLIQSNSRFESAHLYLNYFERDLTKLKSIYEQLVNQRLINIPPEGIYIASETLSTFVNSICEYWISEKLISESEMRAARKDLVHGLRKIRLLNKPNINNDQIKRKLTDDDYRQIKEKVLALPSTKKKYTNDIRKEFGLTNTEMNSIIAEIKPLKNDVDPSEDLIQKVKQLLPPQPWPQGTHTKIKNELGISNKMWTAIINKLVARGEAKLQIEGVLYAPETPIQKTK